MSGEQGGALTPRTFAALPSRKCISPSPLFVPPLFSVRLVELVAAGLLAPLSFRIFVQDLRIVALARFGLPCKKSDR